MKQIRPLTLSLLAALTLGALPASAQQPLRVGLSFDIGGRNDKSFNQASWAGAQRAMREFKIKVDLFEPKEAAQVGQGVKTFGGDKHDLVIGVGFSNTGAVNAAAGANSETRFAVVDDLPKGDNTTGLLFREHEGSFLVGFIAGKTTSTNVVGFVGGMDIPIIHKFEAGFRAGVLAANPKAKVVARYAGTTPQAFNDPAKGRELATALKTQGVDIVFAAAGATGNGVINFVKETKCLKAADLPSGVKFVQNVTASVKKAADYTAKCSAADRPMFFIGVDSNQNYLGDTDKNPKTMNHGLTSMLKRVDVAVYNVIRDLVKGERWRTGSREFALGNDGVGYALDEYNEALLPDATQKSVELIKSLIVKGTIQVPKE